ncbi:MAG: HisA/HisF-related TIM barrel protein, partial [Acidimicrobiia bacterium]|nr:HisA/HisF-related TIM barrel protein [Acidimicrobiia bacterium]
GWQERSGRQITDVARELADAGVEALIVTEIERDGTLDGPDISGLSGLLAVTGIAVIASGGVGSLHDIDALRRIDVDGSRLAGVIVGRAIYDGAFSVGDVQEMLR